MNKLRLTVLCLLAWSAASNDGFAQNADASAANSNFSSQQLDQLVAPVALYPDPLLADVLTGSTYPLEVVDADHWTADPQNSALSGDDLTDALSAGGWDPSVQSLVPFPQVLQLMDNHLDWMETLGEAFLAQPGDVMDAVQRMRARAQGAGNLASNSEQLVSDQNGVVAISPPADLIDVPEYDPWCAFGNWPYPVASPSYFGAWSGNCDPADYSVVFGPGIAWPFPFWGWSYFDWRQHHVLIHPDKYRQFHPDQIPRSGVWTHDPRHRDGVLYRNARNIRAFGQPVTRRVLLQMRNNLPVRPVRSAPPTGNWSPGRIFRMQPRPAAPANGNNRAGFGQLAPGAGKSHASRTPDRH